MMRIVDPGPMPVETDWTADPKEPAACPEGDLLAVAFEAPGVPAFTLPDSSDVQGRQRISKFGSLA